MCYLIIMVRKKDYALKLILFELGFDNVGYLQMKCTHQNIES
ncbi:MAG: hypothetical protein K0Q49_1177 [Haloplasmataceae bacterium]|nr:hypothetical protein [Haloplasmataceae bacterium]